MNRKLKKHHRWVSLGLVMVLICTFFVPPYPLLAAVEQEQTQADQVQNGEQEKQEHNSYVETLLRHANDQEVWTEWLKQNAFSLDQLEVSEDDDFADLDFLKPLLEDQRIVMLGESSHGVKEFNSVKVRLVQYLHQELGFNVLAFESGWAEAYAVNAQLDQLTGQEMMEKCIFPVWHTEEVLPLFEYIREQADSERPLQLAGFDLQPMYAFSEYVAALFAEVDLEMARRWEQVEESYRTAVYSYQRTEEEFKKHRAEWIAEYEQIEQFLKKYKKKLAALRPDQPELITILERAIAERKKVLMEYVPAMLRLYHQDETTFALPTSVQENFNYLRDLAMAEHLTWLAEEMYPNQKIIVWGHNYHLRKQNSSVKDDPLFMGLPMPTMGELLPARLQMQTYSIGLYMYQGESANNIGDVEQVRTDHDPHSIEAILHLAGRDNLFVDLKGQVPNVGNAWMFTPRQALYWGMFPETFIPRNQYDGLLWIDTVSPPDYTNQ